MSTVNRCIAIAAHGRRCQQTTYRGGPYCWHHTQSRKVWPPSRVSSRPRVPPATPSVADLDRAVTPIERIAAALTPEQLDALATFLGGTSDGTFRIESRHGEVVVARREAAPPYPGRTRSASA